MHNDLRIRWLRLKRHLLTCADSSARRSTRRARRPVARLAADSAPFRGLLCRRSAALAA
jgi:hypothetical protein